MTEQIPTKYKIFRYDPDREEVVLVREGVAEPVDVSKLSPELQRYLAGCVERLEEDARELKRQAEARRRLA